MINQVKLSCQVEDDLEVTLEANPGDLSSKKLEAFLDSGVNRVSLGLQVSFAQI